MIRAVHVGLGSEKGKMYVGGCVACREEKVELLPGPIRTCSYQMLPIVPLVLLGNTYSECVGATKHH